MDECECLSTSREVLVKLNGIRAGLNLQPVTMSWFYRQMREEYPYILPTRTVGTSYLWPKRQVCRIIKALRDAPYRPSLFKWSDLLAAA